MSQKTFGITFEEELKQLFNSSIKNQKIFTINGAKIAIIFNPLREALKVGCMTVKDAIALVSDKAIPSEIVHRMNLKVPSNLTDSTLCIGRIHGLTPFQSLGLE